MDEAVRKYFHQSVKEKIRLTGGYTFNTWLLVLENGQKIVFRTAADFVTGGGRKIMVSDIFQREKFFYDSVNKQIGRTCPEVYVIDDTLEYYNKPFQISEYMEGIPLNLYMEDIDRQKKDKILYNIGEAAAKINSMKIGSGHTYVKERGPWEAFMAERLYERLIPHVKNEILSIEEAEKIAGGFRRGNAKETLAFLHLDMRPINMICSNGEIFVLDAENCEFGDPLFEFAVVDMGGNMTHSFLAGYRSIAGDTVNHMDGLYDYYKMERQALVLSVFMDEVKTDINMTRTHLAGFYELKEKLLGSTM